MMTYHLYTYMLLLLLLSRFSCVQLCATPWTAAYQASPSVGFSRQEHWSGLPFPSPMRESEREGTQSCTTISDPVECSLPGSSIHGIFRATVLEWGTIAFPKALHRSLKTVLQFNRLLSILFFASLRSNLLIVLS